MAREHSLLWFIETEVIYWRYDIGWWVVCMGVRIIAPESRTYVPCRIERHFDIDRFEDDAPAGGTNA